MKPLWIALVIAALGTMSLSAQVAKPSARLEVKTAKTGKTLMRLWETDYGSYDRDHFRTTFLDINVMTVGRASFDATLEIVFHGKHPATKQPLVASWQTATIKVEPGKAKRYVVSSGIVKSNTTRYAALGEFYGSGTNLAAWVVRLKVGEEVIAQSTSGLPFDFAKLNELVANSVEKRILDNNKPEEAKLKEMPLNAPL